MCLGNIVLCHHCSFPFLLPGNGLSSFHDIFVVPLVIVTALVIWFAYSVLVTAVVKWYKQVMLTDY